MNKVRSKEQYFSEFMELAQAGELQSAQKNIGPYRYNPYHARQPLVTHALSIFMNNVLTHAQEEWENGNRVFSSKDIFRLVNEANVPTNTGFGVSETLSLADETGYLYKIEGGEKPETLWSLTKKGLETEPTYVAQTKNGSCLGCLGFVAVGAVAWVGVGRFGIDAQTGNDMLDTTLGLGSRFLGSVAAIAGANEVHDIITGHEAYKLYQEHEVD